MRAPPKGFTLVELAVTIAILALLLGLGVPGFTTYSQSAKLRNAAESFFSGVQRARTEAIRSNETIELVLTEDVPDSANVNTLGLSPTGRNWAVRAPGRVAGNQLIDFRMGSEGKGDAVVVSASTPGGAVNLLRFNGLGVLTAPAGLVTVAFTHQNLNLACSINEGVRCVNVRVSPGGQARLCEPGRPATDSRSC